MICSSWSGKKKTEDGCGLRSPICWCMHRCAMAWIDGWMELYNRARERVFVCVRLSAECESAQLDTRRVIRNGRGRGGRARVWRAAGGDEPTRIEAQARDDPAEPRGGLRHTRSAAVCSDLVCVLCCRNDVADYRLDYRCVVFFGLDREDATPHVAPLALRSSGVGSRRSQSVVASGPGAGRTLSAIS